MPSCNKSYQKNLIRKEDCFETTIYTGDLTKECIARESVNLMTAFPALDKGFFSVFSDRIKANNYTDERLHDAIAHVIDNCIYPTPTIAQFISFDKRINLYTYKDMLKLNDQMNGIAFKEYRPVKYSDNPRAMYASINDIKQYGLTLWTTDPK